MTELEVKKHRIWKLEEYLDQDIFDNKVMVCGDKQKYHFEPLPIFIQYVLSDFVDDITTDPASGFISFLADHIDKFESTYTISTVEHGPLHLPGPFYFITEELGYAFLVRLEKFNIFVKNSTKKHEKMHHSEVITLRELRNRTDAIYKFYRGFYNYSELRQADTDFDTLLTEKSFASQKAVEHLSYRLEQMFSLYDPAKAQTIFDIQKDEEFYLGMGMLKAYARVEEIFDDKNAKFFRRDEKNKPKS